MENRTHSISRKGIAYHPSYKIAAQVAAQVRGEYPAARVVGYGLGWGAQIRKSGAYLDLAPDASDAMGNT